MSQSTIIKGICALVFLFNFAICSPVWSNTSATQSASNPRATWGNYNLQTNYYETVPDTGVTREYFFDIVNSTASPDGRERNVLLVNGQFPGPTIEADWGDTVVVHVRNSLENNGTAIHFHGIRQYYSNQNDGVQSLTQCPIAPGQNYTYTWRADTYGSSWYHSHFSLQAWEGVFGGIVIHGPASADYDEDLGSFFLSDWAVETVDAMYPSQLIDFWTPQFDGGLMNGTAAYTYDDGTTVGKPLELNFTPGKKYRLRLINASVHTMYKFSIDNHNMTVIGNDFVAIEPFSTNYVGINSGQRYDIIVEAGQPVDNYWMRSIPQTSCSNNTRSETQGIIRYAGAADTNPTSTAQQYSTGNFLCYDMEMEGFSLTPMLALNANISSATYDNQAIAIATENEPGAPVMGLWKVGASYFQVSWDDPTLLEESFNADSTFNATQNVVQVDTANQWTVMVIQNTFNLAHPVHLHGHDFWVLAAGIGNFTKDTPLNTINPPRRDTATISNTATTPGYLVLAWPADNPGVWLMHCHVGFHAVEGFALQVLERKSEIAPLIDQAVLKDTCDAWEAYAQSNPHGVQNTRFVGAWDSGV